jgi:hypothetical protein
MLDDPAASKEMRKNVERERLALPGRMGLPVAPSAAVRGTARTSRTIREA